jgi:hypothetical protein
VRPLRALVSWLVPFVRLANYDDPLRDPTEMSDSRSRFSGDRGFGDDRRAATTAQHHTSRRTRRLDPTLPHSRIRGSTGDRYNDARDFRTRTEAVTSPGPSKSCAMLIVVRRGSARRACSLGFRPIPSKRVGCRSPADVGAHAGGPVEKDDDRVSGTSPRSGRTRLSLSLRRESLANATRATQFRLPRTGDTDSTPSRSLGRCERVRAPSA